MPKILTPFDDLVADWKRVYDSGHFAEGHFVRKLEEEVSKQTGQHAVAMNSAGSGLYAMLRVLHKLADLKTGIVAVPNNSFFATQAMAVEAFGPDRVKLVDAERETFAMDFASLERLSVKYRIKIVVLTHVGGVMARDYHKIAAWAEQHGVYLIEDAAHAWGCPDRKPAGSYGLGAVFSFYPTKAIPVGEGGMVITKDDRLAGELRRFRNYGKYKGWGGDLRYTGYGFNLRMDEWNAVVALHQVRRTQEIVAARSAAAQRLRWIAPSMFDGRPSNWYKYPVSPELHVAKERQTGKVYAFADQGAQTLGLQQSAAFSNSEWIDENHICLPVEEGLYEGMSEEAIIAWLRGDDL